MTSQPYYKVLSKSQAQITNAAVSCIVMPDNSSRLMVEWWEGTTGKHRCYKDNFADLCYCGRAQIIDLAMYCIAVLDNSNTLMFVSWEGTTGKHGCYKGKFADLSCCGRAPPGGWTKEADCQSALNGQQSVLTGWQGSICSPCGCSQRVRGTPVTQ